MVSRVVGDSFAIRVRVSKEYTNNKSPLSLRNNTAPCSVDAVMPSTGQSVVVNVQMARADDNICAHECSKCCNLYVWVVLSMLAYKTYETLFKCPWNNYGEVRIVQ